MLNGSHDRETGGLTAADVVRAVASSLNHSRDDGRALPAGAYVNVLLVPRGGSFEVDEAALHALGVRRIVEVESARDGRGRVVFSVAAAVDALRVCASHPLKSGGRTESWSL